MSEVPIKDVFRKGIKVYPRTSSDAVVFENENTLTEELSNYEKTNDLLNNVKLEVNVTSNALQLKIHDQVVASINRSLLVNILRGTSYNSQNSILNLTFTNGQTVSIDVSSIIAAVVENINDRLNVLEEQNVVLSEDDYAALEEKDPDKFYYLYEDE